MMAALKSEFRKLLSVRTTYFITLFVLAFVFLIAFYFEGWHLNPGSLHESNQLAGDVTGALNLTVFGAVVAILLVTHEYRYNTIMYTLTSSNRRGKVLFAKFVVVTAYALFLSALIGVLSPVFSYLGIHAAGHSLAPQVLHVADLAWRSLFYGWGSAMAGLILALITRNQIASIVSLFIIPDFIEQTLGFLLFKHNSVYMPFSALSQVLNGSDGTSTGVVTSSNFTPIHAAAIYCVYLVVGLLVGWILFTRRDAN